MRKILTGDRITVSRSGVARHALSATTLLLVGFLVVAFAQLGGGPSASTINRGQPLPACSTATATTAAAFAFGGHAKTVTKTLWKTKTKTVTRTRTKTVCTFVTVTEGGSTTTETVTVTVNGPTSTETETATTTELGPTTTVTETKTFTATQSGSAPGFTCPSADNAGFGLGNSDDTSDPIFCSYPAFPGEEPNDFFCTYSATTGTLVTDHDAGFCASAAPAKP